MNSFARALGFSLIVVGVGCSDNPSTPSPTAQPVAAVDFNVPTGRVALAPITIDLPPRRGLGVLYRNVDCWVRVRSIMPADMPAPTDLTAEVARTLAAAKLQVTLVSEPTVEAAGTADYLLVASLPAAHADLCVNNFFNSGAADVDAQVALTWKLWSVRDKRVVYETTTSGTAHASDPAQLINAGIYAAADDATRQLLGSSAAQQYLTYGRIVVPAAAPGEPSAVPTGGVAPIPQPPAEMKLAPIAPATLTPILVPVRPANPAGSTIDGAMAAAAVTTVGEHGKGLLLGDGYVLTAASLVDSVTGVAVTLPSGASTTATMVRRDNTAGVVLLRVGDTSMPGQPIQPRHNAVGDIVYASGPSGLVKGSFTSTRSSAGFDAVKLAGVAVGSPVMDPAGNVIGLLLPDQHFVSIGVVFHTLQLGAQLTEE